MPIFIRNEQINVNIETTKVRRSLNRILSLLGQRDKEVSILFVDDSMIKEINKKYLGRNKSTNVISFAMSEGDDKYCNQTLLGDIVISADTALRDSKKERFPFLDEIDFLLIHGILHLLGYDHELNEKEAFKMKKKEQDIFFKIKKYYIV